VEVGEVAEPPELLQQLLLTAPAGPSPPEPPLTDALTRAWASKLSSIPPPAHQGVLVLAQPGRTQAAPGPGVACHCGGGPGARYSDAGSEGVTVAASERGGGWPP